MKRKSFLVPIITEWALFTPTGGWATNSTWTGYWRRVGDTLQVRNKVTLSGAPDAVTLSVNVPFGLRADTSGKIYLAVGDTGPYVGTGVARDDSANSSIQANCLLNSAVQIVVTYSDDSAAGLEISIAMTNTAPFTFATGDAVDVYYEIPIVGWKTNRRIY